MGIKRDITDGLIATLINGGERVNIFLTNGVKLTGIITAADDIGLILESDRGLEQLVTFHAIATIQPRYEEY